MKRNRGLAREMGFTKRRDNGFLGFGLDQRHGGRHGFAGMVRQRVQHAGRIAVPTEIVLNLMRQRQRLDRQEGGRR